MNRGRSSPSPRHEGVPLDLHPRLLDEGVCRERITLAYTHRDARAVLASKRVPIRLAPGLPPIGKLDGEWVVGGRLFGDDGERACAAFAAALCARLRAAGDFILFENVPVEAPLFRALQAAPDDGIGLHLPGRPEPHWRTELPARAEDYWSEQFSGKTRGTLRRKGKKLAGELVCYRERGEVRAFLEHASAVSKQSWQMKRLGHGISATPRLRARLEVLAELGALRSYVLHGARGPVAFVLGWQWNGEFCYELPGYDPAIAELSPGTVLLCRLIEHLFTEDTPRSIDFGPGLHPYKAMFGNRCELEQTLFLLRPGLVPAWALVWDDQRKRLAAGLRGSAKALLRRAGVFGALRHLYRA